MAYLLLSGLWIAPLEPTGFILVIALMTAWKYTCDGERFP